MIVAHKIALDPNDRQETYFRKVAGTARFAYNWAGLMTAAVCRVESRSYIAQTVRRRLAASTQCHPRTQVSLDG